MEFSYIRNYICRFCFLTAYSRQNKGESFHGKFHSQTVSGSIDKKARQDWEWLMDQANLGKTEQVDYTIAIYHTPGEPAATGSLDRNILKCLVVCKSINQENLLTHLVMALLDELRERSYTK